ncbi:MAG: nucleoside kinase [Bacteroidaceae bacterium]|nr:nucleoside kinase [Bacteroidaceae bacterium]
MYIMIEICCKNSNKKLKIAKGTSLFDIFSENKNDFGINAICAKVNNRVCSLSYKVFSPKDIEFLDLTSDSAQRTYARTLFFILAKAVHELYPHGRIKICNAVAGGYYCEIERPLPTSPQGEGLNPHTPSNLAGSALPPVGESEVVAVLRIKQKMQEIIDANYTVIRHKIHTEDAVDRFRKLGLESKVKLLQYTGKIYTTVYEIDGYYDYYYGSLLPCTSMANLFDLISYHDGMLLRVPSKENNGELEPYTVQTKVGETFREHHRWNKILGITTIGDFNEAVERGFSTDLINISEALQEKKIAKIAEQIAERKEVKIVLLAGPSSSGKTSTCKRLSIQLITCGKKPLQISLDDYFVDREKTPRQSNGDYDYESIYSLNLDLFNQHLSELLEGKEVQLPRYNFIKGKSEMSDKVLKMEEDNVLVIEGIHALNPMLTSKIDNKHIFRLYASALTSILLDEHNYIPTTDNRLLRRIVRDAKTRGCDARETIRRWPSVREGEHKWIFPFQENADAVFNSAMLFELAVLKNQAEPMLERVPENCPEYSEAYRLLKFLKYIPKVPDMHIPPTSLLREFLGGSSFEY